MEPPRPPLPAITATAAAPTPIPTPTPTKNVLHALRAPCFPPCSPPFEGSVMLPQSDDGRLRGRRTDRAYSQHAAPAAPITPASTQVLARSISHSWGSTFQPLDENDFRTYGNSSRVCVCVRVCEENHMLMTDIQQSNSLVLTIVSMYSAPCHRARAPACAWYVYVCVCVYRHRPR